MPTKSTRMEEKVPKKIICLAPAANQDEEIEEFTKNKEWCPRTSHLYTICCDAALITKGSGADRKIETMRKLCVFCTISPKANEYFDFFKRLLN